MHRLPGKSIHNPRHSSDRYRSTDRTFQSRCNPVLIFPGKRPTTCECRSYFLPSSARFFGTSPSPFFAFEANPKFPMVSGAIRFLQRVLARISPRSAQKTHRSMRHCRYALLNSLQSSRFTPRLDLRHRRYWDIWTLHSPARFTVSGLS